MHKNNFDFLRLIFATSVLITHSYPLSGVAENDWLSQLTGHQLSFSYVAVRGFFVISGYLIYESLIRSKGLDDYFIKRVLRIYPGLLVVLVLSVLLGFFVSTNTFQEYIRNYSVWTYVPKNLSLLMLQDGIDGIFESNPFTNSINGSLWTIVYEVFFYILLAGLYFLGNRERLKLYVLSAVFGLLFIYRIFYYDQLNVGDYQFYMLDFKLGVELGLYFSAGSILSIIRDKIDKYKLVLLIASTVLFVGGLLLKQVDQIKYIAFPLIVIILGSASTRGIAGLNNKIGDMSYGIYIYGFPVQQTLVYFFGLNYLELMLYSIPTTILLGYISWHLVEKRAMGYKKYVYSQTTRFRTACRRMVTLPGTRL